jgi:paraquat-inducible protein B
MVNHKSKIDYMKVFFFLPFILFSLNCNAQQEKVTAAVLINGKETNEISLSKENLVTIVPTNCYDCYLSTHGPITLTKVKNGYVLKVTKKQPSLAVTLSCKPNSTKLNTMLGTIRLVVVD